MTKFNPSSLPIDLSNTDGYYAKNVWTPVLNYTAPMESDLNLAAAIVNNALCKVYLQPNVDCIIEVIPYGATATKTSGYRVEIDFDYMDGIDNFCGMCDTQRGELQTLLGGSQMEVGSRVNNEGRLVGILDISRRGCVSTLPSQTPSMGKRQLQTQLLSAMEDVGIAPPYTTILPRFAVKQGSYNIKYIIKDYRNMLEFKQKFDVDGEYYNLEIALASELEQPLVVLKYQRKGQVTIDGGIAKTNYVMIKVITKYDPDCKELQYGTGRSWPARTSNVYSSEA